MRQLSLSFFLKEDQILLAMKKRGFGVGKWNGYGGKCLEGESVGQAAVREIEEESGLIVRTEQLNHRGSLQFYFPHKPEWTQEVHIFTISECDREPIETEEMKPQWFSLEEIPYASMWQDDAHWLPLVFKGCRIEGQFPFDATNEDIAHWEVREI